MYRGCGGHVKGMQAGSGWEGTPRGDGGQERGGRIAVFRKYRREVVVVLWHGWSALGRAGRSIVRLVEDVVGGAAPAAHLEIHHETLLRCHVRRVRTRMGETFATVGTLKRLLSAVDANVFLEEQAQPSDTFSQSNNCFYIPPI